MKTANSYMYVSEGKSPKLSGMAPDKLLKLRSLYRMKNLFQVTASNNLLKCVLCFKGIFHICNS